MVFKTIFLRGCAIEGKNVNFNQKTKKPKPKKNKRQNPKENNKLSIESNNQKKNIAHPHSNTHTNMLYTYRTNKEVVSLSVG